MPTAIKRRIFANFNAVQLARARLIACWANWLYGRMRLEAMYFRMPRALELMVTRAVAAKKAVSEKQQAGVTSPAKKQAIAAAAARALAVASVLSRFPNLTELEVPLCDNLDHLDILFGTIQCSSTGQKLHTLNLRECASLRSLGHALRSSCPVLRVLVLSGCRALQADGLEFSAPPSAQRKLESGGRGGKGRRQNSFGGKSPSLPPTLVELDMSHCNKLDACRAVACCRELQRLDLSWCSSLVDLTGLSGCVSLRSLDLRWCHKLESTSSLRLPSPYPYLATITSGQSRGSLPPGQPSGSPYVAQVCPSLTELNLSHCKELVDVGGLEGCSSLTRLNLCR
eukprot:SAG31_NODE_1485_length_8151_cov_6.486215_7_plen_341_part_00